jgi:hypothetical protein
MKIVAIVLLLASSASAACFTVPYHAYSYYARSEGRETSAEWGRRHTPRKQVIVTEGSAAGKAYKNYREVAPADYESLGIKPARRVRNPDGSETVYNPYIDSPITKVSEPWPERVTIRVSSPDGSVYVLYPRVRKAN